jgi:hypothetical protein
MDQKYKKVISLSRRRMQTHSQHSIAYIECRKSSESNSVSDDGARYREIVYLAYLRILQAVRRGGHGLTRQLG